MLKRVMVGFLEHPTSMYVDASPYIALPSLIR